MCFSYFKCIVCHTCVIHYRLECPSAGLFQCSKTGLVFRMEGEGEVLYRTVPWDRRFLAQSVKRPAGPLFMFRCLKGSVSQLHLPHCEICPGGGCDFLSVAHVTDDIIEFIPHKITETHVIINIYGFSAYGLIKDKDAPVFPIKAQVLLFYHPSDDPELESVLHVLLLPRNVVLMKVTTTKKFDNDKDYENYTTTFAVFLPAKVKKAELTLRKKKNIAWSILDLLSSLFVNLEHPWKGFYRYQGNSSDKTVHDRGVLIDEEREEVVSKSTKTLQNQTLLDMVVKKGARAQEHFYQVLKEVDPCLVEDLEEQTV
uniref:FIIND domain-containing protein n=1 Tax=Oncorhynchus mykiss TaxID=8022 RepID=A0A8C7NGW5_ONCMY